ncbi:MAG: hypothetical protein ACI91B_005136, partial [Planctomycetota bacterium]
SRLRGETAYGMARGLINAFAWIPFLLLVIGALASFTSRHMEG